MLSLEVRKKAGGAEVHRVPNGAVTVGASSGNEVVVRARGVAGRHLRIFEKDGRYQLDLFKGVDAVTVNGHAFAGGTIAAGDRIAIGEATITVINIQPGTRQTPPHETPVAAETSAPVAILPSAPTEVEYRALRLAVLKLARENASPEDLATAFVDFFDREFAPSEWAVGELGPSTGFRPLASTFLEHPAIPPHLLEEVRAGERIVRSESVTGVLTLVVEPREGDGAFALLVRETPRLPARAVLFIEEAVQAGGVAVRAPARTEAAPAPAPAPAAESAVSGPIENILRQTDDLKKIVETVEREVIERAMRRVEGNQSRGAEVLNISRGSLIAKLKEFAIPDFRYLRRERQKRN